MVRLSNYRTTLVHAVTELIPQTQTATDRVDEAAARRLHINRTDLRCLGAILQAAGATAGKLAEHVGLTRGAMTTALDRLERAGYVRRTSDPSDGRGVRVEATAAAMRAVRSIWEPIRNEGLKVLDQYSDAELEVIRRFLDHYCALQRTHAERLRRPARRMRE
jgi:DNA-binding MarR family transcriptional regulator